MKIIWLSSIILLRAKFHISELPLRAGLTRTLWISDVSMKRAWALPLTEAQQYNASNMVMQLKYVTENSLHGTVPYASRSWSPMGGGIEKHWSYFTLNWNNILRGFNISNWIIPLNNNCFNTWFVCIPFSSAESANSDLTTRSWQTLVLICSSAV